jgi:hypothetical protein
VMIAAIRRIPKTLTRRSPPLTGTPGNTQIMGWLVMWIGGGRERGA